MWRQKGLRFWAWTLDALGNPVEIVLIKFSGFGLQAVPKNTEPDAIHSPTADTRKISRAESSRISLFFGLIDHINAVQQQGASGGVQELRLCYRNKARSSNLTGNLSALFRTFSATAKQEGNGLHQKQNSKIFAHEFLPERLEFPLPLKKQNWPD